MADLRTWLAENLELVNGPTVTLAGPREAMPLDSPLFSVPRQLVKALDRDLAATGISNTEDRGRTLDVHALRHSFGSLLSAGGVTPRTAQAPMRHSSIDLTMNVYTDPRVLNVRGALDALPSLPLDGSPLRERAQATGTTRQWIQEFIDERSRAYGRAPLIAAEISAAREEDDRRSSTFASAADWRSATGNHCRYKVCRFGRGLEDRD